MIIKLELISWDRWFLIVQAASSKASGFDFLSKLLKISKINLDLKNWAILSIYSAYELMQELNDFCF